jgi:hypothetical protein
VNQFLAYIMQPDLLALPSLLQILSIGVAKSSRGRGWRSQNWAACAVGCRWGGVWMEWLGLRVGLRA